MKARIIIASILCVVLSLTNAILVYGQSRPIPNVDSFIEEAILYHFGEFRVLKKGQTVLIVKDSLNATIKTDYGKFKIKLESKSDIFKRIGWRLNGKGAYEETTVTWFGNDTCDVDIYGPSVKVNRGIPFFRKKYIVLTVSCRGTSGYIPTARFVYDSTANRWNMYNYSEILKAKLSKEEEEMSALRKKYYEERAAK